MYPSLTRDPGVGSGGNDVRVGVERPLLSVITPVLNGDRFLAGCLDNVLAQRCPRVEHLIVDGGSADATEAIARDYVGRYATIRLIREAGANQSRAMNLGVERSRGRVIGVLNVDDFYEPGTLQRVIALFAGLPSPSFAAGNCKAWQDGRVLYVNRPVDLRLEKLLLGPEYHQFPFNPAGYFYDRALHALVGPYDESDEYTMDLDFLLRAVRVAHVVYVDETWGNYRIHAEAKTVKDRAAGDHDRRREALLRRHRRQLSRRRRATVVAELSTRRVLRRALRLRCRAGSVVRSVLARALPSRGRRLRPDIRGEGPLEHGGAERDAVEPMEPSARGAKPHRDADAPAPVVVEPLLEVEDRRP
jgi:glycosyltransferase involved in cell wall biosynthesis